MSNAAYRWRDFPFGKAGPSAVLLGGGTSLAGLLSLLFVPPQHQFWIGLAVTLVLWSALLLARRSFASRRKLDPQTRAWVIGAGGSNRTVVVAALLSVVIPMALGWQDGAIWVLYGIAFYAQEVYWLLKWRSAGYPGVETSGWARDDRRPSEDIPA